MVLKLQLLHELKRGHIADTRVLRNRVELAAPNIGCQGKRTEDRTANDLLLDHDLAVERLGESHPHFVEHLVRGCRCDILVDHLAAVALDDEWRKYLSILRRLHSLGTDFKNVGFV